jgi:hypothetical protein
MGGLVLGREVIDQRLGILGLVVDNPREVSLEMRIIGVEALGDEGRMGVVLGKDDRLATASSRS